MTYREYVTTLDQINAIAERQRRSRSEVIRDATAEFIALRDSNLQDNPDETLLETLRTFEAPEEYKAKAAAELIRFASTQGPKESRYCNYSEFKDVLEDLRVLGERSMLKTSDMIRRATFLYTTKHQQPTPIEHYVEKRNHRTTSKRPAGSTPKRLPRGKKNP
jgi:hypothetical protein